MKRLIAVPIMTVVLIAVIASGLICIKHYSKQTDSFLQKAQTCAENDDMKSAKTLCEYAENEWVKGEKYMRLFVNSNDLSDIGLGLSELAPLAESESKEEFLSHINVVRVQLIHLSKAEAMFAGFSS